MRKPSRSIGARATASAACLAKSSAECAHDSASYLTPHMIQLSRNYSLPEKADEEISIKVVGVGDAGSNVLDRIVLDGLNKADLIAVNTDAQSLVSSVAARKVQLGPTVTRGLGAGGDPEVGYNAAYESADEIRQVLADARIIFICT